MNQEWIHKLTELIVAEVVRRVALLERQKQHPEEVLVLLAAPVAYPKELKALLKKQFGEGYIPVSFTERNELNDEMTLFASKLGENELMERATKAKRSFWSRRVWNFWDRLQTARTRIFWRTLPCGASFGRRMCGCISTLIRRVSAATHFWRASRPQSRRSGRWA